MHIREGHPKMIINKTAPLLTLEFCGRDDAVDVQRPRVSMPRPVISGTAGLESVGDAQTEKMQTRSYIICRVWVMMLSSSGGRPGVASMNEYASMVCPAAGSVVFFGSSGGKRKISLSTIFHSCRWLAGAYYAR